MKKTLLFLPGPVSVSEQVLAAGTKPLINHRGPEFAEILGRISHRLQGIFGTSGPVVVFGSSGTGGLEAAVVNMFSPGDRLLSCPVGFFGWRLAEIAQMYGYVIETLDTPLGSALDPHALAARLRADIEQHPQQKDRFRGILLTHNETSTGVQNNMAALAPALREHGGLTVVDSVSGLGASEFRMDDWGYDIVVGASQKALAAPPGIAMIALGERALKQLEHATTPRFYFDLRRLLESAQKGQTPWTPPVSTIFAFDAALERYEREGYQAVWERHLRHARLIRDGFEALGFTIFSKPGAHSMTVVAVMPPSGVNADQLLTTLAEEHDIVLASAQGELSGKVIRMGTMGDIDENDIAAVFKAIASCVMVAEVR